MKGSQKKAEKQEPSRNRQYAALPYRQVDGRPEVLLITSRETKRWVIPKGWPIRKLDPPKTAAREAYEEAGVKGRVGTEPIGTYTYPKRLQSGESRTCTVEVFPFLVEEQLRRWPEKRERTTRWFAIEEASEAVQEQDLRELLQGFENALLNAAPPSTKRS